MRNLSLPAQTRAGASPVSTGVLSRTSNLLTDATAASPAAIDVTSKPPTAVVPTGPIADASGARFELAELWTRVRKHAVYARDPAPDLIGCYQLIDRVA